MITTNWRTRRESYRLQKMFVCVSCMKGYADVREDSWKRHVKLKYIQQQFWSHTMAEVRWADNPQNL
jgi:hypothetical protein